MKNFIKIKWISLILAFMISIIGLAQERPDSQGKEFWLMFNLNHQQFPELTLFITGAVSTTGTIDIPGLSFNTTFSVTPGTITSVSIPATASVNSSNVIENKGIHILAQDEITVYGLNRIQFTTDAFLGLPVDILGTDYITLGYGGASGEYFGIVGTVDGTEVTITPSNTVGARAGGTSYKISLNRGETYQLTGNAADLTGSLISSTAPVSVFGGNKCANIPIGYGYCDHLVQQIPPVKTFGKSFVTVPLKGRSADTFRIIAAQDNTNVNVNSGATITLNKGEFQEMMLSISSTIIADKPVMVAQYSNGSTFDNTTSDPFMMLIPPFEQFMGSYTITTPASGFSRNHLNIVASNGSVGNIKLDGTAIPSSSFSPIGNSGFSGAQIDISLGSHTLESTLPFGVFCYGFDKDDSYGYPGGMSLAPIAQVTSLSLLPQTATTILGDIHCVEATVLDQDNNPLEGIRVDFEVSGDNIKTGFANTDANGLAEFCYTPENVGEDIILAKVGTLSDNAVNEVVDECNENLIPEITKITGPTDPVALGNDFTIYATISDNIQFAYWYLSTDGENFIPHSEESILGSDISKTFNLDTNVYSVKLVIEDACGLTDEAVYEYVVIFNPDGGFVTGGGWIHSPAGAYVDDASLEGKASFGFVAKYKSGRNNASEVDGNTNFQFRNANFHFKSSSHDDMSLVISGDRATYRGVGTINGSGNYKFMVVAIDGDMNGEIKPDKFRIKIWESDSDYVIYDNQMGETDNSNATTELEGGSIMIHKPKGNKITEEIELKSTAIDKEIEILEILSVAPNPMSTEAVARFSVKDEAEVILRIFDYQGREISVLFSGSVNALEVYDIPFERNNMMSGVYILKLTTARGYSYDRQFIVE